LEKSFFELYSLREINLTTENYFSGFRREPKKARLEISGRAFKKSYLITT